MTTFATPGTSATSQEGLRILVWHRHGSWATAFVQGPHTYLVPVTADRGPDGRGRSQTVSWPDNAVEVEPGRLRDEDIDVVVLQRPGELELTRLWTGRRPGVDVPAVYVEHDTPRGPAGPDRHPVADREDIPIAHVTHFNQMWWDSGRAPNTVIEHGIVDPGHRWTGTVPHAGVVVNEPVRRSHIAGTDLLPRLSRGAPLDVFGMRVRELPDVLGCDRIIPHEDLPQPKMHAELAARRVYLHPYRWTSLGLALLEAMHLGMPIVAVAATEVVEAVPPEAGAISTRVDTLIDAVTTFTADPDRAREAGNAARRAALRRYSLDRFLADWTALLHEVRR
ncbi:glycosyltransferase [Saccharopolyspora mangrovi]|uniref:Glycosyltransferase n=1 Tax=Saccharopolyspora mangrovi TaxID=3082379 RepID=A0ABU6ACZ4_9PSEU|nr:glycosyltransferase [Saccharopolyspora sp. S2-29]MEB3369269.1 glycosyltransferase [Saccharopolyspora sp. S2-29]